METISILKYCKEDWCIRSRKGGPVESLAVDARSNVLDYADVLQVSKGSSRRNKYVDKLMLLIM